MDLKQRKDSFVQLGTSFGMAASGDFEKLPFSKETREKWRNIIPGVKQQNGWFTPENVKKALKEWSEALKDHKVEKWLSKYRESDLTPSSPKKVGVVMAGNIPLVGLHDLISILIAGHEAIIKLSSDDQWLMKLVIDSLVEIDSAFENKIQLLDRLKGFDAVIATGSNNTARYFEAYFGKYPHIIRKNRSSVAVLSGNEDEEELKGLQEDIFSYFGLGCRNVSKLFVPENYDLDKVFKALYGAKDVIDNHKYANNYDHNRTVYLMKKIDFLENGFVIMLEHFGVSSPVGVIYYEKYEGEEDLAQKIKQQKDQIQCIVSGKERSGLNFGQAQKPELWDYADDVDTLEFLTNISS